MKAAPPDGQLPVLQSTSILRATLLRSKHDDRSVETVIDDSSPIMDHGSMFEGVLAPPASKPLLLTSSAHNPPAPAWLISSKNIPKSVSGIGWPERNNITAILNDMRDMPGLMSQFSQLPVSVDEDLANCILPGATQSMIFSSPSGIHSSRSQDAYRSC